MALNALRQSLATDFICATLINGGYGQCIGEFCVWTFDELFSKRFSNEQSDETLKKLGSKMSWIS